MMTAILGLNRCVSRSDHWPDVKTEGRVLKERNRENLCKGEFLKSETQKPKGIRIKGKYQTALKLSLLYRSW